MTPIQYIMNALLENNWSIIYNYYSQLCWLDNSRNGFTDMMVSHVTEGAD